MMTVTATAAGDYIIINMPAITAYCIALNTPKKKTIQKYNENISLKLWTSAKN